MRRFKVQVGGLGGPFEFHFRSSGGLGGHEATGKGFGGPWVGPPAAGDPEMDPTWSQLEPSWKQFGANMGPT